METVHVTPHPILWYYILQLDLLQTQEMMIQYVLETVIYLIVDQLAISPLHYGQQTGMETSTTVIVLIPITTQDQMIP